MRDYRHSTLDWTRLRPPDYLLGVALLIWGALAYQIFFGLLAACLLEGHQKVQRRFTFRNQDYVRLWNLCVALFLMVAVFQVVGQEVGRWQLTRSFQKWMPMLLFPMVLAQYYSKDRGIPITTFSIVARRKRLIDERAGRRVAEPKRAHLGFLYFSVLLLSIGLVGKEAPRLGQVIGISPSSGLGHLSSLYVIVGGLVTWALFSLIPATRRGFAICVLALAIVLGYQLQIGIRKLHHYVEAKATSWITSRGGGDPDRSATSFGDVGELKLSPKVFWRVSHLEGHKPTLLADAIYNTYNGRHEEWRTWAGKAQSKPMTVNDDERSQWELYKLGLNETVSMLEVRGRAAPTQLLPRIEDTALVENLPAANMDYNPMGTIFSEPRYSAIRYLVSAGPPRPGVLESAPILEDGSRDLELPSREEPAIKKIVKKEFKSLLTSPAQLTSRDKIAAVKNWFLQPDNRFVYSKFSTNGTRDVFKNSALGPVSHFLTKSRSGHCEYYATATALLLRNLKVPTRYTVGYALQEQDPKTGDYLLRGTHRHAWVRAWVEEEDRWVDVDTTPSDWVAREKRPLTAFERFAERWEHWMLSWNLWRRDEDKGLLWTLLPLLLAGSLLTVVMLRLIRGLRNNQSPDSKDADSHNTALQRLGMDSAWFELESHLSKHVIKRSDTLPAGAWCRQLTLLRPDLRPELPELIAIHYRYRFDPQGVNKTTLTSFQKRVVKIVRKLETGITSKSD